MKKVKNQLSELDQEIKAQFKRPSPIAASKAPTGRGVSKGDVLVQRLAVEFQHDPVSELVKLAKSKSLSPELKARINMELLTYYIPKLKAIDTNPNQGEIISINILPPDGVGDKSNNTITIGR